MKARIIGRQRKDGKYKVSFSFEGGPNGFGGSNFGKTTNKIMTAEAIRESIERSPEAYSASTVARFSKGADHAIR